MWSVREIPPADNAAICRTDPDVESIIRGCVHVPGIEAHGSGGNSAQPSPDERFLYWCPYESPFVWRIRMPIRMVSQQPLPVMYRAGPIGFRRTPSCSYESPFVRRTRMPIRMGLAVAMRGLRGNAGIGIEAGGPHHFIVREVVVVTGRPRCIDRLLDDPECAVIERPTDRQ